MKTVRNIPRALTEDMRFLKDDDVWISIGEPGCDESIRASDFHMDFWDIINPVPAIGGTKYDLKEGEELLPMTEKQAEELYTFLCLNRDKNIVVNCAAGISRSGAVCRFCEDYLGHEWEPMSKLHAQPNIHVYNLLRREHLKTI